ncbi:LRR receptor-like serine/threonine-protein kinase EFR isoform X1 [Cryptomeria japonica]|uniref:LRR receptor-like serine/threonine-protein kinase EFR isoform X1 n=1 Tax=Cryptomeria japonica TaxID=3369 RepID=UPI0027DA3EAB|nr:LRR receptor-like serine/threonine-protein kinase EFR isoform X1 [Cryptomeria japonica]
MASRLFNKFLESLRTTQSSIHVKMKMKMALSLVCPLLLLFLSALPCYISLLHSPSYYSDQQALLSFKHSLSLDPNNSLSDWSPHHYLCNWTAVACSSRHQRVVSLNLTGNDMTPHIADFGITKLLFENSMNSLTSTTSLKGSIGYFAPEYGLGGSISTKGDVYSYGILLLELLTRRRPTDTMFVEGINLPKWASIDFPNKIEEVVDNQLLRDVNESNKAMVLTYLSQFMQVGLVCTRELPQQRPNMMEIVERLEKITSAFLGTPRDFHLPINILPLLESTNEPRNCNSRSPENWSTSTS